jgi:membrane dipeptidase
MGRNKKYTGFKSLQYLEPGRDYKAFKLRKALIDEWEYWVPLSKNEEERFEEIIEKNIIIDMHGHPVIGPEDIGEAREMGRQQRAFIAYEALSKSGLDGIIDWSGLGFARAAASKHGRKWSDVIANLGMRLCDIAKQDFLIHCKKAEDVVAAYKGGKIAWIAGLETSASIENEVDRIDMLYGLGIRCMGITYSESNMMGSGKKEYRDAGLSDFGYDALMRMNKLGVLVDVSHSSDLTAMDVITHNKGPTIISHSGTRTLTPTRRTFPDEVLQSLAEKGGVIAILAAPNLTVTEKHPKHSIESYMEHIEYCINLIGVDHVGVGPDSNYGDHAGAYRYNLANSQKMGLGTYMRPEHGGLKRHLGIEMDVNQLLELEYVKGVENPTEAVQNVARWMVKHGYSDKDVAKVAGGNALRVFKKVW